MSPVGKADRTRKAFITGAAHGIGLGLVKHLLERGFSVVAADLDELGLRALQDELQTYAARGSLITRTLDVQLEASIQSAQADLDGIDVLVNNAGLQHVARLEEFPPEKWEQLIGVMLTGSARLMRAVLPGMTRRGFGRIVNIGSVHSLVASPYKSAYVAAKHGLLGLSKVIALETASVDITVNTICPSYVRTALVEQQIDQQARTHGVAQEEVIQRIMLAPMPKGRFIEIEEIGAAVDFLAGDLARNITGQCFVIDGGWTCK
jgi:3-hydroxybutyrate dehydrogenase